MKDMTDIEKLMRDNFAEAESPAPADAWESIVQKVATAPNAMPHKAMGKGWRWVLTGVAAFAMAGGLLWWGLSSSSDTEEQHEVLTEAETEEEVLLAEVCETARNEKAIVATEVVAEGESPVIEPTPATLLPKGESSVLKGTAGISTPIEVSPSAGNEEVHIMPQEVQEIKSASTEPGTAPKSVAPPQNNPLPETPVQPLTLRIPNLITPNFDGINDCWIIDGIEQYNAVHVRIFTARNKCIYESRQYGNDFCGEDFPEGQYFYLLTAEKEEVVTTRRGILVIKR